MYQKIQQNEISNVEILLGPSSFHFWSNINDKRVLLLGEHHYPKIIYPESENVCEIHRWLKKLSDISITPFDILIEYPSGFENEHKGIFGQFHNKSTKLDTYHASTIDAIVDLPYHIETKYHLHFSDIRKIKKDNIYLEEPFHSIYNSLTELYPIEKIENVMNKAFSDIDTEDLIRIIHFLLRLDKSDSTRKIYYNTIKIVTNNLLIQIQNLEPQIDSDNNLLFYHHYKLYLLLQDSYIDNYLETYFRIIDNIDVENTIKNTIENTKDNTKDNTEDNTKDISKCLKYIYIDKFPEFNLKAFFFTVIDIPMDIYICKKLVKILSKKDNHQNIIVYTGCSHVLTYHIFLSIYFRKQVDLVRLNRDDKNPCCIQFDQPFDYFSF